MLSTRSIAAAALSAVALTGACAQSAAADSISYLKGGDVWLSTPDGSRQFQVTTTGGYKSASQSDDGTIVALKGQRIHKLDRFGSVLADISTAVSDGEADDKVPYVSHFVGPHEVDLSPNGRKIAINWHWQYWSQSGWTGYHWLRQGVSVSATDHTTGWDEPGMGYQTGWVDSAWYDDDTLVYGGEATPGMMDISFNDVGRSNTGSTDWFHHTSLKDMRMPAVSPGRERIAVIGDSNNEWSTGQQLWVWKSTGDAPALPNLCNAYGNPSGGFFAAPSFSPDGNSLSWEEGDGVHVVDGQRDCDGTRDARLLIPGGSEPDWSAAGVPTSRPAKEEPKAGGTPPPAAGGEVRPGGSTTPAVLPGGNPGSEPASRQTAPSEREAAAKPALTLTFACRRACTVSGKLVAPKSLARKLKLGGSALATGTARRGARGDVVLALELTAKGRKAAAKLKGRRLTLKLAVKEAGKTRRLTKSVSLDG